MRLRSKRQRFRARLRRLGHVENPIVGCNTADRIVALTFDDGPDPTSTTQILSVLREHQARATFFVLGRNVDAYPDHARRITAEGHAVGNHGYSHRRFPSLNREELIREIIACDEAIFRATRQRPRIARPPFGHQTPDQRTLLRRLGYQSIFWSASGEDWKGDSARDIASRVIANVGPGGIILLHDGWEPPVNGNITESDYKRFRDRTPTVQALPMVLQELTLQGYRFVTIPELLRSSRPQRVSSFIGDQ